MIIFMGDFIMEKLLAKNLFTVENTMVEPLFEDVKLCYEVLPKISDFIKKLGPTLDKNIFEEKGEQIWIAKSAKVAPSASITGPCIIGEKS